MERLKLSLRSSMVDMGSFSTYEVALSQMLHGILGYSRIQ